MTTVDTLVSFAQRVEDAERERTPVDWRRVFIALLTLVPYIIGKLAGWTVRALMWTVAAAAEGYREARNAAPQPETRRPAAAVVRSTVER